MPAIPPLASEQETKDLVAYVRLLSPGFSYYSLWCGGCHGDDGSGEGVFATGPDAPKVSFDRAYLKAQDPTELRRNVVHMLERQDGAMPHFERDLSEAQARAIVEYLRGGGRAPKPAPSPPPAAPPSPARR
jgi:mono/diheme cytochrome c family protein